MGMSTHVEAFKQPDEKWQQMKAVWDACQLAGVSAPPEVREFFDYREPDPYGARIEQRDLLASGAAVEWNTEDGQGFEVHVALLPPETAVVRFYNSY